MRRVIYEWCSDTWFSFQATFIKLRACVSLILKNATKWSFIYYSVSFILICFILKMLNTTSHKSNTFRWKWLLWLVLNSKNIHKRILHKLNWILKCIFKIYFSLSHTHRDTDTHTHTLYSAVNLCSCIIKMPLWWHSHFRSKDMMCVWMTQTKKWQVTLINILE